MDKVKGFGEADVYPSDEAEAWIVSPSGKQNCANIIVRGFSKVKRGRLVG
ncbi:hypothetical protein [Phyllobacterium chamaecytisi]|nr:hypothetical protein [Phyllobacterium sp. KW56]MBZ9604683.1 hypothetical protein [Phyllobacterium sp. KW56]